MKIGNKDFLVEREEKDKKTYVIGILNVTPDSFSDGGRYPTQDKILRRVAEMLEEGMDILDVGGESTRPGYTKISEEEEIARVIPTIEKIKTTFDIPISLDTYKMKVAKAGIEAGVDLINDIWGLRKDARMAALIAESGVACCFMHNRQDVNPNWKASFTEELLEPVKLAEAVGIAANRIILDPGIGFAKTREQNLEIMNHLEEWTDLGYPLLLGASRKSVIGDTLHLPAGERLEGTLVTTVMAVMKGCSFVRVHDVKEHVRAIKMTRAILES
jgi:dihydropteroate synthase